MVGGTGLYWQSALDGCFEDETEYAPIRAELQHRLHCEGLASLYEELGRRDPVAQARLQPGDAQRILRALEVAIAGKRYAQRTMAGVQGAAVCAAAADDLPDHGA